MPAPRHSQALVDAVIRHYRAGASSPVIGARVGLSAPAVRGLLRRLRERGELDNQDSANMEPGCEIEGVRPADYEPDEDDVYRRALEQWQRRSKREQRRQDQRITFTHGPAALILVGDQHIGGSGVDVPRLFDEADRMARIPGARVVVLGDIADNFILSKMAYLRRETRFSIPDEWALLRRYLRIIAPRLAAVVAGNHDLWTKYLAGFDYFREVIDALAGHVIYASYDARLVVQVGPAEFPGRLRHHWRGTSIYNPTHGIERAALFDHDFLWGVGAHTHRCGVARGFPLDGGSGMAVLVGSYKRHDDYAEAGGFPLHNAATCVGIVFDESGGMVGFEDLGLLERFMFALYRG